MPTGVQEKEFTRARSAAYRYLTYRSRSAREVAEKLRGRGFDDAVVRQVMAELTRLGYVDDRVFTEQWAESRLRLRSFGRRRIERELIEKGVDRDIVRCQVTSILSPQRELSAARRAAERKLRGLAALEPMVRRRRLAGFLERKGFSYDVIRVVLRERPHSGSAETAPAGHEE